ncbi:MAG TPA: GDSL-type esterase/lipase family protein [Opitutaceae bacterium]|jgi:lysophospholipase L1-like esterase
MDLPRPALGLRFLALLALALAGPAARAAGLRDVPASDPHFAYDGRFDASDPARPVVIWEASTVAIDFSGPQAAVRFGDVKDQVFFDATLDGTTSVIRAAPGSIGLPVSGSGRHHLILFKRTEATAGTAVFLGISVAADARVRTPRKPDYRMTMHFIGDSITAGACDEDGPSDQWEDRGTHDAAYSWAALTAAAFHADYQNLSVSGIGMAAGWDNGLLEDMVWDRVYPDPKSPKADLTHWKPDVIFIYLGENDDSYPREHHLPFPPDYVANYEALYRKVRAAAPRAHIVLVTGGMWGGHNSPELAAAWGKVAADLEREDGAVSHFRFQHWSQNHPRVADHKAMAAEIIAWLGTQPFMLRFK